MNVLRSLLSRIARPFRMILASPLRLVSAPRIQFGLSLPARLGWFTFFFLLILSVILFWMTHDSENAMPPGRGLYMATIGVLLILVSVGVYFAVKVWLEGPPSQFADIDKAWHAGLEELAKQGVDPQELPIFLIQGSSSARFLDSLMKSSQQRLIVSGVPDHGVLRWYATRDAVYLAVVGELSQMAALAESDSGGSTEIPQQSMRDMLSQTLHAMDLDEARHGPPDGGEGAPRSGTLAQDALVQQLEQSPVAGTGLPFSGTMMPHSSGVSQPKHGSGGARLNADRAATISDRIQHVCKLLSQFRQPMAPANGLLSLVPLKLASNTHAALEDVQHAFRGDLAAVRSGLRLRCPAIALITGMETELGFCELVRRIGPEAARGSRFGKGSRIGTLPTADHVEAVTANACASFETWAFNLFRKEGGLSAFGNPKLYALICRIRTELREPLQDLLAYAYGHSISEQTGFARGSGERVLADDALLFGGCYFAATGNQEDLCAFVSGVFGRFHDPRENLQDHLAWVREAEQEDDYYQTLANVGFAVDGLLLLAILGFLLLGFLSSS